MYDDSHDRCLVDGKRAAAHQQCTRRFRAIPVVHSPLAQKRKAWNNCYGISFSFMAKSDTL